MNGRKSFLLFLLSFVSACRIIFTLLCECPKICYIDTNQSAERCCEFKVFWVSNPPPTTGNNYHGFSIVKIWQGCKWSAVLFWQSLREEKQNYEMELARVRAKYEEETSRLKDSHTESLEDLQEKHRVQQESARNAAEREKSQLLNVRTHTCVRIWRFRFAKDDKCMFLFADFVLVAALFSVFCLINCLKINCTSPKCIGAGLPVCKTN